MRILLAEDERSLSRAVVALLEKNNYSADAVYDGEEALAYLEGGNYDGVILDIMMPKVDGLEVLRRLRQQGNPIPVLLLTAKSEVEDKVTGLDMGANDYLTKPFSTAELMARIRAMTRSQTGGQVTSRLTLGNITLHQTTFELSSPAGSFRLANKEYQMMELLLRNPRQLIPTERFLERIWGYDSEVELSVVWVYISYLRKKLAALQADIQIKAKRNAGYSLEVSVQPMLSCTGDEKAIRQLISILLDNALKYSPQGGKLALKLEKQGRGALLTVSNTTAQPMERDKLSHLFDRFYRTDQSRSSQTGGYGLGLSIARSIVLAHKGKIRAESPDGTSLSVAVTLPG